MREVLTPEEVADYLQLTKDTIYRLIREHRLAATRIGRSYRIPKEDLDTFILANSTRPIVRQRLFERVFFFRDRRPQPRSINGRCVTQVSWIVSQTTSRTRLVG